jgi:hypothetical protein
MTVGVFASELQLIPLLANGLDDFASSPSESIHDENSLRKYGA